MVNKGLSNNFQVSHSLTMSQMMPSGYRFGATYVGSAKVLSPQESYPVLIGDIDMSGNLQANIIHAPTDNLRCKLTAMIQQSKWQATQMTADYRGSDYTGSLTLGNPDLVSGTGVMVAHYLQKCSEELQVGAEIETNVRMQESVATVGYQLELPRAGLSFRGCVDSNWAVKGVLEKKLLPIPFTR